MSKSKSKEQEEEQEEHEQKEEAQREKEKRRRGWTEAGGTGAEEHEKKVQGRQVIPVETLAQTTPGI